MARWRLCLAGLLLLQGCEAPWGPEVQAAPLSTTSIQVSWQEPPPEVTEGLIGYVLHIRRAGESDSRELQEAVSKTTFQHLFTGLAPATPYRLRLRAWSPLGASQASEPILATTMGSIPAAPSFFTKVLNASVVQVFRALPPQPGRIEGFTLFHRKLPSPHFEGPQLLASTANSYVYNNLEPSAPYELQLQAFNGNGDSNRTVRVVRLEGSGQTLDADPVCHCRPEESSLAGVVVGVHIGMACIIFCLLFLMFGYRRRLFCGNGTQDSWTVPQGAEPAQPSARSVPQTAPPPRQPRPPVQGPLYQKGPWGKSRGG
ncbi:unnamed protein product [Eretmochelys imbricata]